VGLGAIIAGLAAMMRRNTVTKKTDCLIVLFNFLMMLSKAVHRLEERQKNSVLYDRRFMRLSD
jgi:hypothetical protein